jgi:hypothetical protein
VIVKELFVKLGLKQDHGSFHGAESAIDRVAHKMELLGHALAIHYVWERLIEDTARAGTEAKLAAEKFGISVEAYQGYKYAAEVAGLSAEGFQAALSRLGAHMRKTGDRRSLEQGLESLADRFAHMKDGSEKIQLARNIFGRGGTQLIPMLNEGSKGLRGMRAELAGFGILSKEDAEHAHEFHANMVRLKYAGEGVRNVLGSELIKALTPLLTKLLDWVKANRTLIRQKVIEFAHKLVSAFQFLGKAIAFLAPHLGQIAAIFVTWKILQAVSGVLSLAAAFGKLALFMAPLLGLYLIIEDIALAMSDSKAKTVTGKFLEFLKTLGNPTLKTDPWWLKALKTAYHIAQDIKGVIDYIAGQSVEEADKLRLEKTAQEIARSRGISLEAARGLAVSEGSREQAMRSKGIPLSEMSLSERLSLQRRETAGEKFQVRGGRVFNVTAPITVNSSNPEAAGRAVQEHLETHLRAAEAGR